MKVNVVQLIDYVCLICPTSSESHFYFYSYFYFDAIKMDKNNNETLYISLYLEVDIVFDILTTFFTAKTWEIFWVSSKSLFVSNRYNLLLLILNLRLLNL